MNATTHRPHRSLAVIVLLTCEVVIGAVGCTRRGKPRRGPDGGSPGTPAADAGGDAGLPGAPEGGAGPDVVAMPPGPCDPAVAHERANRATARWLADFWNGGAQYLEYLEPGTGKLTGYWNFAQAIDLAIDAAERTRERRFGGWPWALILGQEARGWTSDYYDDLNWMALALIRAYELGGDRRLLDRAITIYREIMAAWDTTCCGGSPGGIWWDKKHTQKATAANAGPVITGVRLAAETGDAAFLAFARQVYLYWITTMRDPATHQIWDHILPTGVITKWRFTYNEGLMIGAALALHEATREPRFLAEAHGFARYLLAKETRPSAWGPVLWDGPNDGCAGDCQMFKGIGYRYLAALWRADPREEYRVALAASAESLWTVARDPATDRFATDWTTPPLPPETGTMEPRQSAATMALNIWAGLCGPAPVDPATSTPPMTITLEAEEGLLRRVSLEQRHPGFSGWSYLAAWNAAGMEVELTVRVPAAGPYRLDFEYAAAAGEAKRALLVGAAVVDPALTFPSTGATWDRWGRRSVTVTLAAGANRVTLSYDAARGSAQYLNLDKLTVTAVP